MKWWLADITKEWSEWISGPWHVHRRDRLWYIDHHPDGAVRGQVMTRGRRLAWWRSCISAKTHVEVLVGIGSAFEVRIEEVTGRRYETRNVTPSQPETGR